MNTMFSGYDDWRLAGPQEDYEVGTEVDDECGRYAEPDEDAPRGYRPKSCTGTMENHDGCMFCDTCGEMSK